MSPIDISYWDEDKIAKIATKLLEKVADDSSWGWKVEAHAGEDDEPISTAHFTLSGSSNAHKLSIEMLDRVPWTTRWKLYFTVKGQDYMCLEELFDKIPALKRLQKKLDDIARAVKARQDRELKKKTASSTRARGRGQKREADDLIAALRR